MASPGSPQQIINTSNTILDTTLPSSKSTSKATTSSSCKISIPKRKIGEDQVHDPDYVDESDRRKRKRVDPTMPNVKADQRQREALATNLQEWHKAFWKRNTLPRDSTHGYRPANITYKRIFQKLHKVRQLAHNNQDIEDIYSESMGEMSKWNTKAVDTYLSQLHAWAEKHSIDIAVEADLEADVDDNHSGQPGTAPYTKLFDQITFATPADAYVKRTATAMVDKGTQTGDEIDRALSCSTRSNSIFLHPTTDAVCEHTAAADARSYYAAQARKAADYQDESMTNEPKQDEEMEVDAVTKWNRIITKNLDQAHSDYVATEHKPAAVQQSKPQLVNVDTSQSTARHAKAVEDAERMIKNFCFEEQSAWLSEPNSLTERHATGRFPDCLADRFGKLWPLVSNKMRKLKEEKPDLSFEERCEYYSSILGSD